MVKVEPLSLFMPGFARLLDESFGVLQMLPSGRCCFLLRGFVQLDSWLLLQHLLVVGVLLSSRAYNSFWLLGNGLLGSLQDCLVEGLDFGIQVLPFTVDPLRKLVS